MTQRHRKPENWLAAMARQQHGIVEEFQLSACERAAEAMLMGLRLNEGVDLRRIAMLTGLPVDGFADHAKIGVLEDNGLLVRSGGRLRVTASGALLLDAILAEIVRLPADTLS
jgi:oxygen-independent coproporphyrinogen-3 oxidase